MSNHEWKNMDDAAFEDFLENIVPELPPEDIVTDVTPWRMSMNRILVGMALTTITLNFWLLNYILPAIGTVLMLLGFRTLRQENKWFRNCFIVSVIRTAYLFPALVLNTTIIHNMINTSAVEVLLTIINLLFLFFEYICLWRGFRAVQQKAGFPPHAGSAVALIVWYVIVSLLSFVQFMGLVIAGAMVIGYICIIYNLYKLSKELDEAGYTINAASHKKSDQYIVTSLSLFLVIGFTLGYLFGGSYPMEWTKLDSAEHSDVADIKEHLTELGFPEYVLDDLTAEDIAACKGALRVVVDVTDEPVNDGRVVTTEYKDESNHHHIVKDTVYDVREVRITGVGVQVPGDREKWILFHHFLWTTAPKFYGTESIQLWTSDKVISDGWRSAGDITGRVLCDKNGETLIADYYSLGTEVYTSNDFLFGVQSKSDVFASFSMPRNGDNHRGYIAYSVMERQDGRIISSWFNYTHQRHWLQYPVLTAMEKRMVNDWSEAGAFKTIMDSLEFYPTEDSIKLIN